MRYIAQRYISETMRPAAPFPPPQWRQTVKRHAKTILLGALSGLLYFGLYTYDHELTTLGTRIQKGEHMFFLLPIAIAFAFSLVHGIFTSYFWDSLGVQAKK